MVGCGCQAPVGARGVRHHWQPGPVGCALGGGPVRACCAADGPGGSAVTPPVAGPPPVLPPLSRSPPGARVATTPAQFSSALPSAVSLARSPWRSWWLEGSPPTRSGGVYCPPVTMADLQQVVSNAVRKERAAQSQSSSMHASLAYVAPRQVALPLNPPPATALSPQVPAPTAAAPAASAPAPGLRLRLPPVPPVAGVEFVAAGGGAAGAQ
ncbi:unnamed protein product [Closterium sp. Naga37s-1]|nr:unnamed protein product [Closterium sp. Naga37s-1]